ncbi:hypothetical protein MTF65_03385 [Streptomyces sp. APSN-46.1]|uniref:hypothetical protein n=1 Tax=Streptomyces sp. APSN-46.1 TaxID=2929049 RepID=UPI001FB2F961|nr:hypothetical protein [Streptomyces sp. APSN-46.1]MCJ1676408.1 hypothetical protein [Streptomyces sp. APSN-46.1]
MSQFDELLGACVELLAQGGLHISVDTLRVIILVLIGVIVVRLAVGAARAAVTAGSAVVSFTRTQIESKFWRDPGKLSTVISFVLFGLAYGLYGQEQSRPLSDALTALGTERLTQVVTLAILTHVVLLVVFWITFGLLSRTPWRALVEPFKILLGLVVGLSMAIAASVGVLLLTGDDAENAVLFVGLTMMAGCAYVLLGVKVSARLAGRQGRPGAAAVVMAFVGLLLLFTLVGSVLSGVYAAAADEPSVEGLLGFDLTLLSVVVLFACFRFRAFMDAAAVPPAVPHLIDLSLAVAACAIALARSTEAKVTLGTVPPWVVVVGPPLITAAVVYLANLRRHLPSTPNRHLCLTVALAVGLLAGPAQPVLADALAPVVELLPLPRW